MSTKYITFIVPTLNSSRLLGRLVRSLQTQTWPFWRVVIIDHSSLPGEREYLDALVASDSRFNWVVQGAEHSGIFGAMNHGLDFVNADEWVLFWGSDDWLSSPRSLELAVAEISFQNCDMLVCSGRYISDLDGRSRPSRHSSFNWFLSYRISMLLGSTPPHQCTLFSPFVLKQMRCYDDTYRIAGDLRSFLFLSSNASIEVARSKILLVDMAIGGVSSYNHRRRIGEVQRAYRESFGCLWLVPFLLRYLQRLTLFL